MPDYPLGLSPKENVGIAAADLVEEGMLVGLGTGSTAACFIDALAKRCQNGLNIKCVATSNRSEKQARDGGIPVIDVEGIHSIDLCIDGADEIDPMKRMIKGGGGALLREKIIATASKEMVVIIDESKRVKALGQFPLPIEIVPFGSRITIEKIKTLGLKGSIRRGSSGDVEVTDNQNYLFDLESVESIGNPETLELALLKIPGVVETGLFLNIAGRVIIGKNNGSIEVIE